MGVTGILRCHNAADFLGMCIDSCIEGLDELVAVYHDCTDDTPRILADKQAQYPDKIKVYEYTPYVFPMEMDESLFSFVKNLPSDSAHLMSGYSNYALSKATYRYVVKIDADQVYFSEPWKRICEAYRSTVPVRLKATDYAAYRLYRFYIRHFSRKNRPCFHWFEKIAVKFYPYYFSYLEKRVIRDKVAVSLSGINLFHLANQWRVGLGERHVPELFPLFNGVGDHFFFELSEETFFQKWIMPSTRPGVRRVIEVMFYAGEMLDGGFFWFHLKPALKRQKAKSEQLYETCPGRMVSLEELQKLPYPAFREKFHPFFPVSFTEPIFSYFYTATQKLIPWNELKRLEKRSFLYKTVEKDKPMSIRDYYVEFHEELDKRLETFIFRQEQKEAARFMLGCHSVKGPLTTHLFYHLMGEREYYNFQRLEGKDVNEAMKRVDAFLELFATFPPEHKNEEITEAEQHPWHEMLSTYKNQVMIYLFNARQLTYLTPLINKINRPVLLLTDYDISEETELPEYVTALMVDFSDCRAFANPYIEQNFPLLFQYANAFRFLLRILQPCGIICLEGCHMQEQLLGEIANDLEIPSVCIQQGWPSCMRTGFRRLPFRYFFTWGERFSELWKKYNPLPEFLPMGYMYEVPKADPKIKCAVAFFLQSPLFLSDPCYFESMLELIGDCAEQYPGTQFLVREHPEYKLSEQFLKRWEIYPHIQIVSNWDLKQVYAHTLVTVSHFSSALVEGIIYDSIPLVYDPTTDSRYYPDIEKDGVGKITRTKEEFHSFLKEILLPGTSDLKEKRNSYQEAIKKQKQRWSTAVGDKTLHRMVRFIYTNILKEST